MKIYGTNLSLIIKRSLSLPLHLIYFLSYLSPRNKKIWVFGNTEEKGFSGNPKYIFLYIVNNKKDKIKAIWISRRRDIVKELKAKGYESYYNRSLKGLYYTLKAKYFFVDGNSYEINYWLSGGSKKIILTHGIPLKKVDPNSKKDRLGPLYRSKGIKKIIYRLLTPWVFERKDFTIATSPFFQNFFDRLYKLYGLNNDKVVIAGYPRNDVFFHQFSSADLEVNASIFQKIKDFKDNKNVKVIIYLPTFRETGGNPLVDAGFDFDKLKEFLVFNKAVFITKLHMFTKMNNKDFQNLTSEEFLILPAETDIYPILPYVDILITDYSSVYFDFLLLDKPVIFFPYDYEKYITKDRGLGFNYEEFTPGPKAYNFDQLIDTLEYSLKGRDEFKDKRKEIRNFCFKYIDGKSSERIFRLLWH